MTNEQKRIAIAEACGWQVIEDNARHPVHTEGRWTYQGRTIPDYLNDLNAMHKAEETLDANQWAKYDSELESAIRSTTAHYPIHATASERAGAFLIVISKTK